MFSTRRPRNQLPIPAFVFCLVLFTASLLAATQAQANVTIGYQVVKVDGTENRWFIYMKVINNHDSRHVDTVWVRTAPGTTGTPNTANPEGWSSAHTTDTDGEIRGAVWATGNDEDRVKPGSTKTGFVWEVESAGPPELLMGVANYTEGGGEYVTPTKVVVQTENQNCEDPEEHGFQRDTELPGMDWQVIPDGFFQFEDCVLAVGDILGSPPEPYHSGLQTPPLDLTEETEPSVQFTSLLESNGAGIAAVCISPDGGMTWLPVLEFGFECTPETPCGERERIIIALPELAGMPEAMIRWDFMWNPIDAKEPLYASWIIDDLVVLGDVEPGFSAVPEPSERTTIGMAAPAPNPFAGRTRISFRLTNPGHASLRLYDLRGRHVRTLVDGYLAAGPHLFSWDARDEHGRRVAAGVYSARLVQGGQVVVKKVLVLE
jgi:hypothetical protein